MNKIRSLTPAYSMVQASFWMSFCVSVCFAAVYLQALGFQNFELGAVLAAGNILGAILGPMIAAFSERHRRISTASLKYPLFFLRAAALLLLFLHPGHDLWTGAAYAIYIALTIPVNALDLKLCVDAEREGLRLDYGVARGIGSLAFVLLSAGLGWIVDRFSVSMLPLTGAGVLLLQILSDRMFSVSLPGNRSTEERQLAPTLSMWSFFRSEPRFTVLLIGSVLIFFAHNASCNFMINITENVGGDTAMMGYLNAFMAAMEIPVMLLFSRFLRGKRVSTLLRLSLAAFVLKTILIALASSVPTLFAAHVLQAASFALYSSAVVPYLNQVIGEANGAKAQSLAFSTTTLGSVLSSLVAGRLYDVTSVRNTMLISTAVCAVGALVAILGTERTERTPEERR